MEKFIEEYKITYDYTDTDEIYDIHVFNCEDVEGFYSYLKDCSIEEYIERRYREKVEDFKIISSFVEITENNETKEMESLRIMLEVEVNKEEWDLCLLFELPESEIIETSIKEIAKLITKKEA